MPHALPALFNRAWVRTHRQIRSCCYRALPVCGPTEGPETIHGMIAYCRGRDLWLVPGINRGRQRDEPQ